MTDPGSSMSLTAVVVLTVVVLVAMAGWLGAVFFMAREPRSGGIRPGEGDPGRASHPEAVTHPGDVPAAPAPAPGGDSPAAQAGHSPAPARAGER